MANYENIVNYIRTQKEITIPELQKKFSADYFGISNVIQNLVAKGMIRFKSGVKYSVISPEKIFFEEKDSDDEDDEEYDEEYDDEEYDDDYEDADRKIRRFTESIEPIDELKELIIKELEELQGMKEMKEMSDENNENNDDGGRGENDDDERTEDALSERAPDGMKTSIPVPKNAAVTANTKQADNVTDVPIEYIKILGYVIKQRKVSITEIRAEFGFGFHKIGLILEWMEKEGFITPHEKHGRKVLLTQEEFERKFGGR